MPMYVALIKGRGEGCDYTIDCNKKWKIGVYDTKEDFLHEILEDNGHYYYDSSYSNMLDSVKIFEVQEEGTLYGDLFKEFKERQTVYKKEEEERKERELLESLKAKYDK